MIGIGSGPQSKSRGFKCFASPKGSKAPAKRRWSRERKILLNNSGLIWMARYSAFQLPMGVFSSFSWVLADTVSNANATSTLNTNISSLGQEATPIVFTCFHVLFGRIEMVKRIQNGQYDLKNYCTQLGCWPTGTRSFDR